MKILFDVDRQFIESHCPGVHFQPLATDKGRAVRDPDLVARKASNRFWLSGGTDVWRRLRFEDRIRRINRPLALGDSGEFVVRLQRRLRTLRYIAFKPDGRFSQLTEDAIRSFQKDHELPVTGKADKRTIKKMGIWFDRTN